MKGVHQEFGVRCARAKRAHQNSQNKKIAYDETIFVPSEEAKTQHTLSM